MEEILPNKEKARSIATLALAKGDLVKQPCEKCGSFKSEMHHVDYSQPLTIMWLCRSHHMKWHAENPKLLGTSVYKMVPVRSKTKERLERELQNLTVSSGKIKTTYDDLVCLLLEKFSHKK